MEKADSVEMPDSVAGPSDLDAGPEFASEMEIIVQPDSFRNFVLLADGDHIVEEVLVEILGRDRAGRAPEPRLFFNDVELQKQETLAGCGIKLGSVLHLKCTPRVLACAFEYASHFVRSFASPSKKAKKDTADSGSSMTSPAKKAKKESADSGSSVRSNGDGEMKIFVQSRCYGNYTLAVDSSNTIRDLLITTVVPIARLELEPKPKLYFNGQPLERDKSLAEYGIQDGSILPLEGTHRVKQSGRRERRKVISKKKRIILIDRPFVIWEKEHDKVLLRLLVEQIRKRGIKTLYFTNDFWRDVAAMFNEETGLKYESKHLADRFNFYYDEYLIVNRIRHHQEFGWDHQRHVVIATDANWNEYIKGDVYAAPYRWRAVPYIDLLEIIFADN